MLSPGQFSHSLHETLHGSYGRSSVHAETSVGCSKVKSGSSLSPQHVALSSHLICFAVPHAVFLYLHINYYISIFQNVSIDRFLSNSYWLFSKSIAGSVFGFRGEIVSIVSSFGCNSGLDKFFIYKQRFGRNAFSLLLRFFYRNLSMWRILNLQGLQVGKNCPLMESGFWPAIPKHGNWHF